MMKLMFCISFLAELYTTTPMIKGSHKGSHTNAPVNVNKG
jgi:hypothetical protein